MDILIRHGESTDYLWIREHEPCISEETLKRKIDHKELYLVQDNDKAIGFLSYNLFWDHVPFMNKLYLLEEYRRKGIGTRPVNHWEGSMKRKGYKNVLTSTQSNEGGRHFYRKIGYTEIGGFKYLDDPYEIIFYKKIG
jgi:ribosomal protein S18 acetylase RimI-like enzyme